MLAAGEAGDTSLWSRLTRCEPVTVCRWHDLTPANIVLVRRRVLFVHSYSTRYFWSVLCNQGFLDGLYRWGYSEHDLELKAFWMDTKACV